MSHPMQAAPNQDLHAACSLMAKTPQGWGQAALSFLPELLLEQAHLERKAAAAAQRFLFVLPPVPWMQKALSVLAREELVHFERSLRQLERRGIEFAAQEPSRYASRQKPKGVMTQQERLCEELLLASLIEARSHERMSTLAAACAATDPAAQAFYDDLVEAEARHRCVYIDVAAELFGKERIAARFAALAAGERDLLAEHDRPNRLHSGHGAFLDG